MPLHLLLLLSFLIHCHVIIFGLSNALLICGYCFSRPITGLSYDVTYAIFLFQPMTELCDDVIKCGVTTYDTKYPVSFVFMYPAVNFLPCLYLLASRPEVEVEWSLSTHKTAFLLIQLVIDLFPCLQFLAHASKIVNFSEAES